MLARQTGQPLSVMSPAVAEKTAQEWESEPAQMHAHFAEMRALLDAENLSYAQ
jgi:hypothetical protein